MLQAVLFVLTSCQGGGTATVCGDDVALKYAELLTITKCDGYTVAEIKNPWSKDTTAILHRYILVPNKKVGESTNDKLTKGFNPVISSSDERLEKLPEGDVIRVPLRKTVVYTSVHASLINEIGAFKAIRGVCDANFMYFDKVHEGIKAGTIADCGEGMTPDIEKIMDIQPDAILLSPFENSGTYGKLGKIGIPLVECADYMENSPLGRAEWMKFYGMLFGCEKQADSLFAAVENSYNELTQKCGDTSAAVPGTAAEKNVEINARPLVFTEKKTGDTWYVAGGESYISRMISDAGGDYIFKSEKGGGSQPYNPEVVLEKAQDADVWLLKYSQDTPLTLPQLADEWGAYKSMKAYKSGNVWGCNLSKSLFYEETPFHPDLLLKDFVKIIHPDILKDYSLRYYKSLYPLPLSPEEGKGVK